jgi:hypothetical protein
MNNKIFITEQGKQEIEAKITELVDEEWSPYRDGQLDSYKKILSLSTILPVTESWENITISSINMSLENTLVSNYENGVIIQPKQ